MAGHVFQHVGPFEEGEAAALGTVGDVAAMLAVVAQGLVHFNYAALLD